MCEEGEMSRFRWLDLKRAMRQENRERCIARVARNDPFALKYYETRREKPCRWNFPFRAWLKRRAM